ncbi:MAG: polyhydroxybutyrate depolymerase [Solirubrobacterales bacterium]|jgi:polyhydroxybutyrate depolymerase|nr:polyhydroxybutyrate depolymerase [Solirubrobacterales bacterium]
MRRIPLGVLVLGAIVALGGVAPAADFGVPCATNAEAGTAFAEGVNCRVLEVDGYPREYLVYVPASASARMGAGELVPLVLMLHGTSGDGEKFLKISGWREKADAGGFIAAFPTGLTYRVLEPGEPPTTTTKWNSYDLASHIDPAVQPDGYPAGAPWPADDVSFLRGVAADVATQLPIDTRRIFLSGFSNGGEMCSRIGIEASDLFAAVGCNAGTLETVHRTTTGHPNIPMTLVIGTIDPKVLARIQAVDPSYREIPLDPGELQNTPVIRDIVPTVLTSLALADRPVDVVTKPTYTELTWRTGAAGNTDGNLFRFWVLKGVEHEYPNGTNNPHKFVMADAYWDFFNEHPLTVEPPDLTPDTKAPNTKIKKDPPNRTDAREVTYKFKADDAGATFACKLDHKGYKDCKSPDKLHVKPGQHTFRIRARDAAGNQEEKPAKDTFRVVR